MSTKRIFHNRLFRPFPEFERLHHRLDQLFAQERPALHPRGGVKLNAWSNEDGAIVQAEIPGVSPSDVEISVQGRLLTIAGEITAKAEGKYLQRERSDGRFSRQVELPFAIDPDAVEASYDNGLLNVQLPRLESSKPRVIPVKQAD